jgi:hypothetical protein
MAILLEAVGFNFNITGIAETKIVAFSKFILYFEILVKKVPYRIYPSIQIMMAPEHRCFRVY